MATKKTQAAEKATKAPDRFTIYKTECSWKDALGRVNPGDHGTSTQYARALRVGAKPCQKCKDANTAKDLAWRAAHPEKKSGRKGKKAETNVVSHTEALRAKDRKPGPVSKPRTTATKVA
jgi:hypothetical protein